MALNLQVLNREADMLGNSKHEDWMSPVSKIVEFTTHNHSVEERKGESKLKRRC